MFASLYFVLLLFFPILAVVDFEYTECDKSWLCLVDGECAVSGTGSSNGLKKVEKDISPLRTCNAFVQIRRLKNGKDLVILKHKDPVQELMLSVDLGSSQGFVDRFGCKKNGNMIQPVVAGNVMELEKSASYWENGVFTCAGYVSQHLSVKDVRDLKLTITSDSSSSKIERRAEIPLPLTMDNYKSCDSLLVNAKWDLNKIEKRFLNPKKIIIPQHDSVRDCSQFGDTYGLYYKKFLDFPSQQVTRFFCSGDGYKVELEREKLENEYPIYPFSLFCAENVNTKCVQPEHLDCANCTKFSFVEGKGHVPATLKCIKDGYTVLSGGKNHEVAGTPICQGRRDDPSQPVWTIKSYEGELLIFTEAACNDRMSCPKYKELISKCPDGDSHCTQGKVSHSGVICPSGLFIGFNEEDNPTKLKVTKEQKITCDPLKNAWTPSIIQTNNAKCYVDTPQEKKGDEKLLNENNLKVIVLGTLTVLFLVFFIVLLICLIVRCRREDNELEIEIAKCEEIARAEEMAAAAELKKAEETEGNTEPKDGLAERKERYPFVDVNLLTRKDESTPLLFHNLVRARSDYICKQLMDEFERYSVFERIKFAERTVYDLGARTVMVRYLEFFIGILKKEDEFGVWDNLISGIKIMTLALKRERLGKSKKKYRFLMTDKLALIIGQFGRSFLSRHPFYPLPSEDEKTLELRSLAFYTFSFSNCTEMIEKFFQLHSTMKDAVPSPLRSIVWSSVVRNDDAFDEVKEMFNNELAHPARNDDTRWGTKREHLIYALCATKNRDLSEPFLNSIIKEPQYTPSEVVAGFTSMVRDYDDCHDGAKFLFSERHNMIKAKLPVETEEYKKIFRMFYQFASISMASDEWLARFLAAEETFEPLERKTMEYELAQAAHFGELHRHLPRRCHNRKKGYHLKTYLKDVEKTFI